MLLNSTFKLWITLEAGHRLGEDRRSGAFELLLVTPLTVGDILGGQVRALRRQFLRPLLVVVVVELIFAGMMVRRYNMRQDVYTLLAIVIMLVADVAALIWVGMLAALTARSQTRATMAAVIRIFVVPWIAFAGILVVWNVCSLLDLTRQTPGGRFELGLWLGTGLLADLFYGLRARRSLRVRFREMALRPLIRERAQFRWRQFPEKMAAAVAGFAGRIVAPRFRKPVVVCLAAVLALGALVLARTRSQFPPPVLVSITQSNAPMGFYPVSGRSPGVFLVLPDGTLWRWGWTGPPTMRRAAVPEQIGAARNWVKATGYGTYCLGLRADGTIWEWGHGHGDMQSDPQPALPGQDWIDIGVGWNHAITLRKDGTLWNRDERGTAVQQLIHASSNRWVQFGAASNWTAVACRDDGTFGLQSDGTLWAWGHIVGSRGGSYWVSTNLTVPTLVCAETNWIGLDANCLVRNRAGELWSAAFAVPDAQAGASAVCSLVSSNWAADHAHSVSPWMKAQVRSDGALWAAFRSWAGVPPSAQEWRQIGSRSDWVEVWGAGGTLFGLTSDGTLWAWGIDLGAEPALSFESRLQLLKDRLSGRGGGGQNPTQPMLKQPRPLLRLLVPNKQNVPAGVLP
jgi:hypothetical protein